MQSCIRFRPKENPDRELKRVSMSIEEYFYGLVEPKKRYNDKKSTRHYKCNDCKKVLYSNLRFMSHVKHKTLKVMTNANAKKNMQQTCAQCYRKFKTKHLMQNHIVKVHEEETSHLICGICELNFKNENLYLAHMKDVHCFKDTPYLCKVCDFRTSYYHEVASHYKNMHKDNSKFLCCFCLDTFSSPAVFLDHNFDHIKKCNPCPKCCLQFVDKHQMQKHLNKDHTTHPSLLKGINFADYEICVFDKGGGGAATLEQDDLTFEDIQMIEQYLDSSVTINIKDVNIPSTFDQKSHTCYGCQKDIGSTPEELKAHFGQQFFCHECPFETFCESEYKKHVTGVHGHKVSNGSPGKKRPQKGKRTKPSISTPTKNQPGLRVKEEIISSDDDVAVVGAYFEEEFSCPDCPYITSKSAEYAQHMKKHTSKTKKGKKRKNSGGDLDIVDMDILPSLDIAGTSEGNPKASPITKGPNNKRSKGKVSIRSEVPTNGISVGTDADSANSYKMHFVDTNKSCQVSTKYLLLNNPQRRQMVMTPVDHNNAITCFKRPLIKKDTPKPPINLHVLERKQTSIMLAWNHPLNCSVTQYRVTFKGVAQPTTQYLPPHQTIVRLVGLRQNVEYVIRVYSVYKNDQSLYNEICCRTLRRDNTPFSSDVIVIDDDKAGTSKANSTPGANKKKNSKQSKGTKRLVVDAESLLNMKNRPTVNKTIVAKSIPTTNTQSNNSSILLGPLSTENLNRQMKAVNSFVPNGNSTPLQFGKTIPFKIVQNQTTPSAFIIQGNRIVQSPIPISQNNATNFKMNFPQKLQLVPIGNPILYPGQTHQLPSNTTVVQTNGHTVPASHKKSNSNVTPSPATSSIPKATDTATTPIMVMPSTPTTEIPTNNNVVTTSIIQPGPDSNMYPEPPIVSSNHVTTEIETVNHQSPSLEMQQGNSIENMNNGENLVTTSAIIHSEPTPSPPVSILPEVSTTEEIPMETERMSETELNQKLMATETAESIVIDPHGDDLALSEEIVVGNELTI